MADTLSQLAEINALLASTPEDPTLLALKNDLLQLIALEEGAGKDPPVAEVEPTGEFFLSALRWRCDLQSWRCFVRQMINDS